MHKDQHTRTDQSYFIHFLINVLFNHNEFAEQKYDVILDTMYVGCLYGFNLESSLMLCLPNSCYHIHITINTNCISNFDCC